MYTRTFFQRCCYDLFYNCSLVLSKACFHLMDNCKIFFASSKFDVISFNIAFSSVYLFYAMKILHKTTIINLFFCLLYFNIRVFITKIIIICKHFISLWIWWQLFNLFRFPFIHNWKIPLKFSGFFHKAIRCSRLWYVSTLTVLFFCVFGSAENCTLKIPDLHWAINIYDGGIGGVKDVVLRCCVQIFIPVYCEQTIGNSVTYP